MKVKKEKGREKSKLRNIFLFDQALLMTKEDVGLSAALISIIKYVICRMENIM